MVVGKLKVNPLIGKPVEDLWLEKRQKKKSSPETKTEESKQETNNSHEINKALAGSGVIAFAAAPLSLWRS